MILAPLPEVDRGRGARVVAVRIRSTGKRGGGVARAGMVSIRIPVQTLAAPVKDPVKRLPRSRVRGELQASTELGRVRLAENKVSVAG